MNNNYDYLLASDVQRQLPYRAMEKSLISAKSKKNPQRALLTNEVNSGGTLSLKVSLPKGRKFEGEASVFDAKYQGDFKQLE